LQAFRQGKGIGRKLPGGGIAAPVGEGTFGAGQGDGVEAGTRTRDNGAGTNADTVLREESDLVMREWVIAEGRYVGRGPIAAQCMQRPQRVEGVSGKAHAPVRAGLARKLKHAFTDRRHAVSCHGYPFAQVPL
jgi:hypothetical protein